jgi:protein tyrosine/serine phosphatase
MLPDRVPIWKAFALTESALSSIFVPSAMISTSSRKKADFEVFYLPIPDEGAPEIEYLEKTLTWIEGCIANQKKVLIHCRYGIGRTGTVAIAYLFKKGLSLRQALNNMKHTPSIPMSDQQWRLLRKYSEKLGMPKAPVLEAQSEKAVASDTFFEKWAIMQKWFETD